MNLTIDFETRCAIDITSAGAWKYAEDQTCTPICLALMIDDQEPMIWLNDWTRDIIADVVKSRPSEQCERYHRLLDRAIGMEYLLKLIEQADVIEAHNAEFERAIWAHNMPGELPIHKVQCTAARAAMASLPRDLRRVCQVLKLAQQKDDEGSKLMKAVSLPKRMKDGTLDWDNDPEKILRTCEYCMQDVRAERAASKVLPHLPPLEREVWLLDQAINGRGVQIDTEGATAMVAMVETYKGQLLEEFKTITGGAPEKPTQVAELLKWLKAKGLELDNMQAETVDKAIGTLEDGPVKKALQIRRAASKSSTAKYVAMLERAQGDHRARSLFMYHGAGTGRWSGNSLQPQNLPSRKIFKQPEVALEAVTKGCSPEFIWVTCGDPMWVASSCIRSVITAAPGKALYVGDLKSIEGRGLAWLADERYILDAYWKGADMYKIAAASIYKKAPEEILDGSFERQIGKVVELACIAEGQLVTTHRGPVPIEKVLADDLVFDGIDFVKHEGVVCRGIKEVITYENLTATPDHIVFLAGEHRQVSFGFAAASGQHLATPLVGGNYVRLGHGKITLHPIHPRVERRLCSRRVQWVWSERVVGIGGSSARKIKRVSIMLTTNTRIPQMALQKTHGGKVPMSEPEGSGLSELRRPRYQVSFPFRSSGMHVHLPDHGDTRSFHRNRSDQQRRALRTGEHSVCQPQGKPAEQTADKVEKFLAERMAISGKHRSEKTFRREGPKSNPERGTTSDTRTTKRMETNRQTARVYDIVNCGPRNRFVVSGVLVHNCGYQGGIGALSRMADSYGVQLPPLDETKEIIRAWRESRPQTVRLWREVEQAAMMAVKNPGQIVQVGKLAFKVAKGALMMRLPSGRALFYQNPSIGLKKAPWLNDDGKPAQVPALLFWGIDAETKQWCQQTTYGGCLVENAVQGLCRDLLCHGMMAVEASGKYQVVLHVHDEIVSEGKPGMSIDEYLDIMTQKPDWAREIPVAAEGWTGFRYKKG